MEEVSIDKPLGDVGRNTTEEMFMVGEDRIETLSVIVWCVGGILLITLLSLLARILLARKKEAIWDEYGCGSPAQRDSRTFRICIDERGRVVGPAPAPSPSRDTVNLVPGADMAVTETPVPIRPQQPVHNSRPTTHQSRPTNQRQVPPAQVHGAASTRNPRNLTNNNEVLTRHLRVGEYINSLPVPSSAPQEQSAEIIRSDVTGSRATLNGVVISPPLYRDAVNTCCQIPSVIVNRDTSVRRHQGFSL